jgi:(1->4)-alpha-D-glucan 1-alpha-D-glucosylmutase
MLLKVMSPGVPDFYQGCELFDLSLVDPDNRRSVDYSIRRATLARVQRSGVKISELLEMSRTEDLKFFFILRALEFRRHERVLLERGDYIPLQVIGTKQEHVCAFARTFENKMGVVVVPRLVVGLTGGVKQAPIGEGVWGDTGVVLPSGMRQNSWREIFSGESVGIAEEQRQRVLRVADILRATPVAILTA